jgi:hypothetical protein
MGSILIPPPNFLKWLADTIRNDYGQLAPNWMTKLDRCAEWELSGPTLFNYVKHTATSEYSYVPIGWHTKRVFRNTREDLFCSRDSQVPRGIRINRLSTLRRPADSACI